MAPRIEPTSLATRDLEDLAAYYLVEAGITVAQRFIERAELALTHLAGMPRMGALVGFQRPALADIRRWHIDTFPRLIILYRVVPDGIQVLRVLDASRDICALFENAALPVD